MLERIKLFYQIYNFFHKKELYHNAPLYKKLGLKKKYYSSISTNDFAGLDASNIIQEGKSDPAESMGVFPSLSETAQNSVQNFHQKGYCLLNQFWTSEEVSEVNNEIERLVEEGAINFEKDNRAMFAIHKSQLLKQRCSDKGLDELLDYLIQGNSRLFQSINFLNGSEQRTHSDSIHMTTFPQGGLLGVWIALEDVDIENGTIHYYPESHQLPYFMNDAYGNQGNKWMLGNAGYRAYEDMIQRKIEEYQLRKEIFTAKAGDLFIWHANLLHGGEPHIDKSRSRKSMVLHYFDTRRICFHEVTQRPALFKEN